MYDFGEASSYNTPVLYMVVQFKYNFRSSEPAQLKSVELSHARHHTPTFVPSILDHERTVDVERVER